jgi:hypothetical protein
MPATMARPATALPTPAPIRAPEERPPESDEVELPVASAGIAFAVVLVATAVVLPEAVEVSEDVVADFPGDDIVELSVCDSK